MNLLFKTYFKLNSVALSKNIIRALQASRGDVPDVESFPKSHQVTFKYYMGVIQFLEEDYKQVLHPLLWVRTHLTRNLGRIVSDTSVGIVPQAIHPEQRVSVQQLLMGSDY